MPRSIRQRLLVFILALTFISWATIAYTNYSDARHEIGELFDAHLVQSAKVLLSLVDAELYEEKFSENGDNGENIRLKEVEDHLFKHKYEKLLAFQIAVKGNTFFFSSAGAPGQVLSEKTSGFSSNRIEGKLWRVYTLQDLPGIITVRVAEPLSVRNGLINEIAFNLIIPLLIGLPVIFLLIWKSVDIIFKPLDEIAADLQQRGPAHLDPVTIGNVPTEVRPLIDAINKLFRRLDKVLQNERRFTADAAHELRTPLAGLKTQTQIALRTRDIKKREHALQNILKSIDRTSHLVDQLLTLARLEPGLESINLENCNLSRLVSDIVDDVMPFAAGKNITIDFRNMRSIQIPVHTHAVSLLIRNLLDNAIRYSGYGGHIDIDLSEKDTGVLLQIADSGPGIPRELREDVFKRFFRANQTAETGSGLGLSIVKQIADLHHARIELGESGQHGLQVDIFFPNNAKSV